MTIAHCCARRFRVRCRGAAIGYRPTLIRTGPAADTIQLLRERALDAVEDRFFQVLQRHDVPPAWPNGPRTYEPTTALAVRFPAVAAVPGDECGGVGTRVAPGASMVNEDWIGVGADYRTFFVHRDEATPRVHRFTTGLTLSLK